MQLNQIRPGDGIYRPTADYVHGIEVIDPKRFVFIAGTMGLRPDGNAGADFEEQLGLVWQNITIILAEADMTVDNIVRLTTYLTDGANAEANGIARMNALKGRAIPTTAIVVETLAADWLVEIEAIAVS